MTNKTQKLLFLDIFFVSLIVLACFLTAIFTNQMVKAKLTNSEVKAENYGNIKFGLIWGTKQYNYGYGDRDEETYFVYDEYRDIHVPLIITLVFVGISSVFTIVSIIFALMNTMTVPIQTLHGPLGLYIWNGIAGGFGLLAVILHTILFQTQIKNDIRSPGEDSFSPVDPVRVGYSFWLMLCGVILVLSNIGIVYLAQKADDPKFFKRKEKVDVNGSATDNKRVADGIIY